MKKLTFVLIIFTFLSCDKKNGNLNSELPECIKNIISNNQVFIPLKTVQIQEVDGEFHYWLNTDARHFDGLESIVNNNCDTICYYCGECSFPNCINRYNEDWQIIWEN